VAEGETNFNYGAYCGLYCGACAERRGKNNSSSWERL
jgi:hypothetical protein